MILLIFVLGLSSSCYLYDLLNVIVITSMKEIEIDFIAVIATIEPPIRL